MIVTITPTAKQAECWKYLQDQETSYIFFGGGAGSSKTFMECSYLFMMASSFPGTRYFVGRAELKAIRGSWLQTMNKCVRSMGLEPLSTFTFQAADNYLYFPNGSRIDFLDMGDEPQDENFERLGSYDFTSGVLDECSEISETAFNILKSRIGRCLNDKYNLFPKILLASNPKKNWLYYTFYKPFMLGELPKGYACVLATALDNPYLAGYTEQLMKITDTSQRERLMGNWEYSEEGQGLISYDAIMDSFKTSIGVSVPHGGKYISVDCARLGMDKSCLVLWSGLRVERIQLFEKLTTHELVAKIMELKEQHHVPVNSIIIDSIGTGAGVADSIPGCRQFVGNATPIEVNHQKANYQNLRTQCFVRLSELITERKIFFSIDTPQVKNDLIEELEQIKLKDNEGKVSLISKADIKQSISRSPDISDAVSMRMYYELKPPTKSFYPKVYKSFKRNDETMTPHTGLRDPRDRIGRQTKNEIDFFKF